jgi:hypothetical protein
LKKLPRRKMNPETKRKREAGKKARNGRTQKKEGGRKERERET